MRIRLTIAAALAVFAISAPLASAESTGEFGAVEGTAEITFITEPVRILLSITVSENACLEFQRHEDRYRAECDGDGEALAPPKGVVLPDPPEVPDPPLDPGRPCGEDACLGL